MNEQKPTEVKDPVGSEPEVDETKPVEKVEFDWDMAQDTVTVKIGFPEWYPDLKPFVFKLGLELSPEVEKRKQKWLALSVAQRKPTEFEQSLEELCDLLTETPEGFSQLKGESKDPGKMFREFIEHAPTAKAKMFARILVIGVIEGYYQMIAPRLFR